MNVIRVGDRLQIEAGDVIINVPLGEAVDLAMDILAEEQDMYVDAAADGTWGVPPKGVPPYG